MALKSLPIQNFNGFSDGKRQGEYYYSQGMNRSQFGLMPILSIAKQKDSTDISGMGKIQFFAQARSGSSDLTFAVDDAGIIYKEASGVYDFAADHTSGQTTEGNGLIGDQKGRLLYPQKRYLGMRDTSGTYTDNWKDFGADYTGFRDSDTYEGGTYIMNNNTVAYLASDDSWNASAFTAPTNFEGRLIRSGRNGLLLGFNFGFQGVLILWDAIADRAIAPWIWVNGKVLAIDAYQGNWIVLTEREILLTNGYTSQKLYTFIDNPLSLGAFTVNPKGILVVGDMLFIMNQVSQGLTRTKGGCYIFNILTSTFELLPISTLNTYNATPLAIFSNRGSAARILVSYRDEQLSKNYIGSIEQTGSSTAFYISEALAESPTEKVAEAVVLNLGLQTYRSTNAAISFDISVKLYNFKRQLWMRNQTNASAGAANQIRVDGTSSTSATAQIGDEITVLNGNNAGQVRHISSIANQGTNTETWTLDSALPNTTGSGIWVQVQPFKLIEKKTISAVSELKDMYFNVKNKLRGKKFLVKVLLGNMTAQPEIHNGLFVYDDQGII